MLDLDALREAREAEYGYREASRREVGLAAWMSDRENPAKDPEFKRLTARLRARNWQRRVYAEGGPRLARRRNLNARWRRQQTRRKWAAMMEAARRGETLTRCRGCGAEWTALPAVGQPQVWCSRSCQSRAYGRTGWVLDGCVICGVEWTRVPRPGHPIRTCSDECAAERRRQRHRKYDRRIAAERKAKQARIERGRELVRAMREAA